ncbi:hypothetical protein FHS18_004761 [Paenibacillus phyllosphaerae]|uniref:Uncharacterized protein n=1 Tax=Paenibacillus phyllosphaerae TaxID=274593 RepID=A0A7W5FPR3_9BACL|nr:hypothetical protein [Paenibacillus phyllosphaerae]MBB3112660.1 hypothetical protein [Paenibacillus phyllosphaerae]
MVSSWITTVVILFGVLVAIIGVFAYLRMYKNSTWSAPRSNEQATPLSVFPPEDPAAEEVSVSTKIDKK